MKTPTIKSRTTFTTTTTTTVAPGVPLLVVAAAVLFIVSPLGTLRGVDGLLASKLTSYSDTTCEESMSGASVVRFGVPDAFNASAIHDFNECVVFDPVNASIFFVCNATTGETGLNIYEGTTCTTLSSEGVALPSCEQPPSSAECTAGLDCAQQVHECIDTVASTISPGVVNFLANEYNDASCADPTGNTEILSGENIGHISGECFELPGVAYARGECLADGSAISQFFSPEDSTCSGDVWDESTTAAEISPPVCIPVAVDGLYYGYTSCTTDAATVLFSVQAPTIAPTAVGIDTAADTPAPTNGDGGRGIGATAPPTAAVSGSGQVEETTSPIESDQAGSSNGAVGAGSGVAAGSAVLLSCLVGLWVFIAL